MKKYMEKDDLPMTLSAEDIQGVLGVSRAGAYQLMHSEGFPLIKFGKRMLCLREDFLHGWIRKLKGVMLMKDDSYYLVYRKLLEYLEASKIPVTEEEGNRYSVICPCCGRKADVGVIPLEERQSFWSCPECGEGGDTIRYAKEYFQFRNETQALQDVCRKLHVSITVLDTVSASDLLAREYEPLVEIVQGLIAPGLFILAGAPKTGKSWLSLDLAVSVSKGEPLWNQETVKSDVLYLALEDPERRIRNRLQSMTDGEIGNLYFATDVEPIGAGFEEQIAAFLENNKNVKMIIVDTFGKARSVNTGKWGYIEDYAIMSKIKKLAMRFDIAIILVHHTNKRDESNDIMAMISGTNGIFGCADGGMVLLRSDRLEDEATLQATSRDFEDKKFYLKFNKDAKCWRLLEDDKFENNDVVAAVVSHVRKMGYWEGTATDLLEELIKIDEWIRTKPNGLARTLNAEKRKLREKYNIEYRKGRDESEKLIILIDCKNQDDLGDE